MTVSLIVHKRELAEATHQLIGASDPDIGHVDAVLQRLGDVLTDIFGVECKVRIHASHAQVRAAIQQAENEEPSACIRS